MSDNIDMRPIRSGEHLIQRGTNAAEHYGGRRWGKVWNRWLATVPEPYRGYLDHMAARINSAGERIAAAERRAEIAERRERDSGRGVAALKRRIAELESLAAAADHERR